MKRVQKFFQLFLLVFTMVLLVPARIEATNINTFDADYVVASNDDLPVINVGGDSDAEMVENEDAQETSGNSDTLMIVLIVFLGVISVLLIVLVVLMILSLKKKREPKEPVSQKVISTVDPAAIMKSKENVTMTLPDVTKQTGNTRMLWDEPAQRTDTYISLKDINENAKVFSRKIDSEILIGRKDADIIIDYDQYISTAHCKIKKNGGDFYLVDLGSANGTRLNGEKISSECMLKNGDNIRIGQTEFQFQIKEK